MPTDHIQCGRDALARGAWEQAQHAFEAAVRHERSAEALEGLGEACWWLNDGPRVFEAREEAYRLYHERGDRASAARIALWLYWDYRAFRSARTVGSVAPSGFSKGWSRRESMAGCDTGRPKARCSGRTIRRRHGSTRPHAAR